MRALTKSISTLFFLTAVCLLYFVYKNWPLSPTATTTQLSLLNKRPSAEQFCFDFAKVLSNNAVHEINIQGQGLRNSFDIDFVVLTIPSLHEEEIEKYAADLFSQWAVGQSTQGKKGILILIAQKEQKIKIEVGYDLEEIYPDLYIGQVEREFLKEFLEQADWEKGFLATIENFVQRIYSLDKKGIDIKEIASVSSDGNYSGGAGAKTTFDFGAALSRPLPDNYPAIQKYFSAQPAPELAFQRYMELCAKAVRHNNDLTLFTELSNKFWQKWTHTSGQMKSEAQDIDGKQYFIREKENHAVVFIPDVAGEDQSKITLYFLSRSNEGWQVDINTMARILRYVGPNWLLMYDKFHPYSHIIMKEYNVYPSFFSSWNSTKAYCHFSLRDREEGENRPGYEIMVQDTYEKVSHLRNGDRILSVNQINVRDSKHFHDIFDQARAGDQVKIELMRDNKKIEVLEILWGNRDGFAEFKQCLTIPRMWLGVYLVQSLDMEWRHTLKLRDQGMFRYSSLCYVLDVYPGSPADRAGLKREDLILDYGISDDNGEIMPEDVIRQLYQLNPGESMKLTILRNMKEKLILKIKPEKTNHKGYF